MTINSREKGKSAERELLNKIKELWPGLELSRNLEQTRNGGHDILGLPGWALEVKRYSRVTQADVKNFWQQTLEQARKDNSRPMLAYRQNQQKWRIVVRASDAMSVDCEDPDSIENALEMSLDLFCYLFRGPHVPVS